MIQDPVKFDRMTRLVAVLRSDQYQQGTQRLCTVYPDTRMYCCEGVASKEAQAVLNLTEDREQYGDFVRIGFREPGGDFFNFGRMPTVVFEYYGFRSWFDFDDWNGDRQGLPDLNDNGLTFAQIADCIEWQYLTDQPRAYSVAVTE